ncbi:MAG: sporulation initiation factor Spo0A C-terminal domain-containing protein [Oscillospiraceae bacterium]|nr:sporulation initiation factor Spo0A C-terminal domain-containing protein [Oscillospiraceae bacterium]
MSITLYLSAKIDESQAEAFESALNQLSDQFLLEYNLYEDSENSLIVCRKTSINSYLSDLFVCFGMPASCKGNIYLKEIISLVLSDSTYLNRNITSKLYPEVAAMYNTNAASVERAIRHAISSTWNKGNYEYLNKVFGYITSSSSGKPTNAEFIARVLELVKANAFKSESA